MESQSVGKNLIYQRKLKGYSQEKLSDKTGVTIRTIQRIEKDEVNPHPETIQLLAAGLEIRVDDLIVLQNPKEETIQLKWLLIMHGLPVIGLIIPLFNILASIFLWVHKREDSPVYDKNGRAIINFQLTITLLFILSFISLVTIEGYGFLFFVLVIPFALITMMVNIFLVLRGRECFYPLTINFLGKKNSFVSLAFAGICVMVLNSANLFAQKSDVIKRLDGSTISNEALTGKILQLTKDANIHGLAVSIFDDNKVKYQQTFGYKDFNKKWELNDTSNMYGASLSKAVFAVLVMKLLEEKVINLDKPLQSYLPKNIYEYPQLAKWHDDYSDLKSDTLYHKITARMCLTHTSGFPNWRWYEPDHKLRTLFEPGHHYSYSGEGLVYLQVVIEKLTGRSLESLAQEKLFKPLGMTRSSYQWQNEYSSNLAYGQNTKGEIYEKDTDNEPRSASTLETSAKDLTLFFEGVLQKKILNKRSWDELMKTQIRIRSLTQFGASSLIDTSLYDDIKIGYGLGWGVLHSPYGNAIFKEGHGSGFQHYCILFPKAGKGVMILSNSDNAELVFKELLDITLRDIYTPWKWQNYIPYNLKQD